MPIGDEQTLKKAIKESIFAPCYFIFGNDAFLKQMYLTKLSEKIVNGDTVFDYQSFPANCDLQDVYNAKNQFPMLSEKKCIVLNDYDYQSADTQNFERLITLLSEPTDCSVLIYLLDSVEFDEKSERSKKIIEAVNKGNGVSVCVDHRTQSDLSSLVQSAVAKRGNRISSSDARYLIQMVSDDMNIIRNEIEKLCAYANGGEITSEMIDTVCIRTVEESVYNLSKRVMSGDVLGAINVLDSLYFMRVAPMLILYNLTNAYIDMYLVAAATKSGVSLSNAAKDFAYGKRDFVLDRARENLRKTSYQKLLNSLELLLKADETVKTFSKDSRTYLEQLIVTLAVQR